MRLSLFACLFSLLAACGGSSADDTAVDAAVKDLSMAACPQNPSSVKDGDACSPEGLSCGMCTDPCQFCNLLKCTGGKWSHLEAFPAVCDDGGTHD